MSRDAIRQAMPIVALVRDIVRSCISKRSK